MGRSYRAWGRVVIRHGEELYGMGRSYSTWGGVIGSGEEL